MFSIFNSVHMRTQSNALLTPVYMHEMSVNFLTIYIEVICSTFKMYRNKSFFLDSARGLVLAYILEFWPFLT